MWKPLHMSRWWMAASVCLLPVSASAGCLIDDAATGAQRVLRMHLSASCTQADREAHAVNASTLLAALKQGRTVDLDGVVVRGDLALETLPIVTTPPPLDGIVGSEDKEVRVVVGGLSVVNSVVQGKIVHRSANGTLVFNGPV